MALSKQMYAELSRIALAEADHGEYAGCRLYNVVGDPSRLSSYLCKSVAVAHTPADRQYLACLANALEERAYEEEPPTIDAWVYDG